MNKTVVSCKMKLTKVRKDTHMSQVKMNLDFQDKFYGQLVKEDHSINIGQGQETMAPYELLFGALGSCLHATFMSIAKKKKISYEAVAYEIHGQKRQESPTTLEWVKVAMTIRGGSDEAKLQKSAEVAAKFCSIYETLSQVAKMTLEVNFIEASDA